MDKRINDFFQDGKVDLVKNEQSSLFNLNGVPNYFTSTWSSDGGPLVHDTYETYRIIFNGRFRNEVIGAVLGSKAPKVTIPPFKLAMADARENMGLSEKDKNTVETVLKAVELFNKNNKKYL